MSDLVLDSWRYFSSQTASVVVIPDGCRDVIFRSTPDRPATVFLSSLPLGTDTVAVSTGTDMLGIRLKPGVVVDQTKLLTALRKLPPDPTANASAPLPAQIIAALEQWCSLPVELDEALHELAKPLATVSGVAQGLCMPVRRLQRLVLRGTGRSPRYWTQLARVRRAARFVSIDKKLAEAAGEFGYADQAHMTRAFRKWLSITPAALQPDSPQTLQLFQSGYG